MENPLQHDQEQFKKMKLQKVQKLKTRSAEFMKVIKIADKIFPGMTVIYSMEELDRT